MYKLKLLFALLVLAVVALACDGGEVNGTQTPGPTETTPPPTSTPDLPDMQGGGDGESTPIPIVPPDCRTPGSCGKPILEIDPWHPVDFTEAYYTPRMQMRIRNAASLAATVVGYLPCCKRVRVYTEWLHTPSLDAWVCLDAATINGVISGSDCHRVVAYRLAKYEYGVLDVVVP